MVRLSLAAYILYDALGSCKLKHQTDQLKDHGHLPTFPLFHNLKKGEVRVVGYTHNYDTIAPQDFDGLVICVT